jgi:PIN domain nuclease of toxin-antitoxin system
MADALIDTHVLLWMLDGSLPRRSAIAAQKLADAITAHGVFVSIGSFLDLRYLVDAGRMPFDVLLKAEEVVQRERSRSSPSISRFTTRCAMSRASRCPIRSTASSLRRRCLPIYRSSPQMRGSARLSASGLSGRRQSPSAMATLRWGNSGQRVPRISDELVGWLGRVMACHQTS